MWQIYITMKLLKTKNKGGNLESTYKKNETLCIEKQQFKSQCIYHSKPWKSEISDSGEYDLLQWCQDLPTSNETDKGKEMTSHQLGYHYRSSSHFKVNEGLLQTSPHT